MQCHAWNVPVATVSRLVVVIHVAEVDDGSGGIAGVALRQAPRPFVGVLTGHVRAAVLCASTARVGPNASARAEPWRCETRGHPADEQRGGGQADVCDGYSERGDSRTPEQQGSRADEARLDQAEARLDQLSELPSGPRLGHVHGHDLGQLGRVVPLRHLGLWRPGLEHWAPVRRGGLAGVHLTRPLQLCLFDLEQRGVGEVEGGGPPVGKVTEAISRLGRLRFGDLGGADLRGPR
mmetsp:Transcript_7277/g.24163  ORF Transcript_7277/g.24163 Transcript_7277/m.24163 type:complete len:236 (+) Transcript_7277:85-792(+)